MFHGLHSASALLVNTEFQIKFSNLMEKDTLENIIFSFYTATVK